MRAPPTPEDPAGAVVLRRGTDSSASGVSCVSVREYTSHVIVVCMVTTIIGCFVTIKLHWLHYVHYLDTGSTIHVLYKCTCIL